MNFKIIKGETVMKKRIAKKIMKNREGLKYSAKQIKQAQIRIDKTTTEEKTESKKK